MRKVCGSECTVCGTARCGAGRVVSGVRGAGCVVSSPGDGGAASAPWDQTPSGTKASGQYEVRRGKGKVREGSKCGEFSFSLCLGTGV